LKHNLKNRPQPQTYYHSGGSFKQYYDHEVTEWFEGFEKELRESGFVIKVWVQDTPMCPIKGLKGATKGTGHYEDQRVIPIKEILGE